jgi:hypothetical protein
VSEEFFTPISIFAGGGIGEAYSFTGDTMVRSRQFVLGLCSLGVIAFTPSPISDPIGIYAVIDKVVLAPASNPTTIEVWGQFMMTDHKQGDHYSAPVKGYLFLAMDASKERVIRAEWNDLQAVAGKGTIIGFSAKYARGGSPRIRCATEAPANPDQYTTNIGVVPLSGYNQQASDIAFKLFSNKASAAPCAKK